MSCHLHWMLVVLPLLLTLIGRPTLGNVQNDEAVTEVVTVTMPVTTNEPDGPCASNPCNGTVNTGCVEYGDAYSCECLAGYTLDANWTCTGAQQFAGSFTITQVGGSDATYSADLANTTSEAFNTLAASVEDALDTVYIASSMADMYLGCEVRGFRNGSVIIDYNVLFVTEDATSGAPVVIYLTTVREAFTTALTEEASSLGIAIDETTITFADFDECASADDNDCHAEANCTNTLGSFTCKCDPEFLDNSPNPNDPGRLCEVPPRNPACDSNPCILPNEECNPIKVSSYQCKCIESYDYTRYGDCEPMARSTDFRCYHCDDSIDNVKCNGRMESENGTAQQCPNPTDTCYQTIQMNPDGDGFMIRKGCMDLEECYDLLYSYEADPAKASCFEYIFPYGRDTPPHAGVQCHYCCSESFPLDLCNYDSVHFIYGLPRINSWDPRMNWDLTMNYVTEEPESGSQRHLPFCGVLSLLVTTILAFMLH